MPHEEDDMIGPHLAVLVQESGERATRRRPSTTSAAPIPASAKT